MITNVGTSSYKVPVILAGFKQNFNFLNRFKKNTQNIKFHENSSSVGRAVPCGRIDRQTDRHDANSPFRNFSKAPKNGGRDVVPPLSTYLLPTRRHKPQDRKLNSICSHSLKLTKGV